MNSTEIITTSIGAGISALIAYFAYKRGSQADENAAENVANAQLYAGYGGLLERIGNDNRELRIDNIELKKRLEACVTANSDLLRQITIMERRLEIAESRIINLQEKLDGDQPSSNI